MIQQVLGGFLIVFVYLTQTEQGYKLSNDPAITTMIISGCYVIALYIGRSSSVWFMMVSPQNPAIALGMMTAVTFKPGKVSPPNGDMSWAWTYLVFPWIGSVVAVAVYEFLFKKA